MRGCGVKGSGPGLCPLVADHDASGGGTGSGEVRFGDKRENYGSVRGHCWTFNDLWCRSGHPVGSQPVPSVRDTSEHVTKPNPTFATQQVDQEAQPTWRREISSDLIVFHFPGRGRGRGGTFSMSPVTDDGVVRSK